MPDNEKELPDAPGEWWFYGAAFGRWCSVNVERDGSGRLKERTYHGLHELPEGRWRPVLSVEDEDALRAEAARLTSEERAAVESAVRWQERALAAEKRVKEVERLVITDAVVYDNKLTEIRKALTRQPEPSRLPDDVWRDAPEWAMHLFRDPTGVWHWIDVTPRLEPDDQDWRVSVLSTSNQAKEITADIPWRDSLHRRPEPKTEGGGG